LYVRLPYLSAVSALTKAKSALKASSRIYFFPLKIFSSLPSAKGVPTPVAV